MQLKYIGFDMNADLLPHLRSSYLKALITGDPDEANRVVDQGIAGGLIPSRLYLDVLLPSQVEVGNRWRTGEFSIPEEHVATQITLAQMARLRSMLKSRHKVGLHAVVTAVAGDYHFVGAQAVADFLVMDGWEVDFIGSHLPSDDLARYVKARQAHLLCVSITLDDYAANAIEMIREAKKAVPSLQVVVGGAALDRDPSLLDRLDGASYARNAQEAVTLARQLCGVLCSENALPVFLRKLGQNIREYRKTRGLSQQELANSSELDRAYISAVEHGKQNISIGAIAKLAKALNLSIEELLTGSS